jgi:hypothetical protein
MGPRKKEKRTGLMGAAVTLMRRAAPTMIQP